MTSFFEIKVFFRFSRKRQDGSAPSFLKFKRKHLFITTCIEKHCTWPLKYILTWLRAGSEAMRFVVRVHSSGLRQCQLDNNI